MFWVGVLSDRTAAHVRRHEEAYVPGVFRDLTVLVPLTRCGREVREGTGKEMAAKHGIQSKPVKHEDR